MEVEIVAGYLQQLALFAQCHRLFRSTICRPPARFYLNEDEIILILGYKIYLAITTTEVALQDTISPAYQCFCRQTLACFAQSLSCALHFLVRANTIVLDKTWSFYNILRCLYSRVVTWS